MEQLLTQRLAEQWRDALSAYAVHHVMPGKLQASALNMITAEHLDRYLMMDTQCTSAVTTSYLAEALACTQGYLNAIFNNIEPGYDGQFAPGLRAFWQQAMSNYSVWAAYQMLEDYPENYIRADLRPGKTQLFQALESELGQGRIDDASTQRALLNYLRQYEFQNSIRVQSGYIDYPGPHHDEGRFAGHALANADYYLLGKDTASPPRYYWRKAKVRLDQASTFIQPDAWSEWQAISMPSGQSVIQARLVMFCGRLYLAWLHHGAALEVSGEQTHRYPFSLDVMYLGLDRQWSTPETLSSWSLDLPAGTPFDLTPYRLLALAVAGAQGSDDQLLIAVGTFNGAALEERYSVQRDVLKRVTPAADALDLAARTWLFDYFEESAGKVALQRRVAGSERALRSIKPSADNDRYMALDALLEPRREGKHRLHLRARSARVVTQAVPVGINIFSYRTLPGGNWLFVNVYSNGRDELELRCRLPGAPSFEQMVLTHPNTQDTRILKTAFEQNSYGWYEARASLDLLSLSDTLGGYGPQAVRDGAGFELSIDGAARQPLASSGNVITVTVRQARPVSMALKAASTSLWEGELTLNGAAATDWVVHEWPQTAGDSINVTFGAADEESSFTLTRGDMVDAVVTPYIDRQPSGTDFLVFEYIGGAHAPLAARLNSQHVPDLINRAEASAQAVFAWDAQHLREPAYVAGASGMAYQRWRPSATDPLMDLYDANGLYLRELFFHVPHLIASRLQEEERHAEARRWLGLIFDPQHKLQSVRHPGTDYWNCAWILQEDTQAAGLEHELTDPHAIALHAPSHYRKAVFAQYVGLLIGEADLLYRRQTRDSLANAWQLYRMAADLMGEAPDARAIDTWQAKTVGELLAAAPAELPSAEQGRLRLPADLPKQMSTFFWAGAAAHPAFRLPFNRQLLDTWSLLEQRFANLRHFLTIDGMPMRLALYAPLANPFDLLSARMGGQANLSHLMGTMARVPAYRFRTLMAKAQDTVSTLIQFGEMLRGYLEQGERTQLETLQFKQAAEIAHYTIDVQQQFHQQQLMQEQALGAQRKAIEQRHEHFAALYDSNISDEELAAMSLQGDGRLLSRVASNLFGAANTSDALPNMFGLANGGSRIAGPMRAAGQAIESIANAELGAAEVVRERAGYQRRRQEWQLHARQAERELDAIDKQLDVQRLATQGAANALAQSHRAFSHAEQLHTFYCNRASSEALYGWLRAQALSWHRTLFGMACELCYSTEACWQYETGNFAQPIIRPVAWDDSRHGLNAGGSLKLELQRLEAESLLRNERHLEIRKTVSLQALLEQGLVSDHSGNVLDDWQALRQALLEHGELSFRLTETVFNKDYPGHYLRRLHSVALTLPALLGPYQNVRAMLTQTASRLLVKPDFEGVLLLSPDLAGDNETTSETYVKTSLRPSQQVCLSVAGHDRGLFTAAETDDRYLPFEGTGAVSDWQLRFPRHQGQAELFEGLSDIIVDVYYFALHGGELFETQVDELLARGEAAKQPCSHA
ncbi:Tc toxin subunit A-related protein [Pseudomonas xanthosomatis]|uniref:Tc toxin subunit A-related protein n=1 Tax=Pseudomonas xanthosomatis TaxID=2842356 RepID=UPI003510E4D5